MKVNTSLREGKLIDLRRAIGTSSVTFVEGNVYVCMRCDADDGVQHKSKSDCPYLEGGRFQSNRFSRGGRAARAFNYRGRGRGRGNGRREGREESSAAADDLDQIIAEKKKQKKS
eukprot:CAMPEP_0184371900 /NCGR_PEP_ID=MMETSP1089-20130417/163656_1 /TAXON_ID=38269 ORGANISM="Gloeochaete wittrockiana, Strain SAG46.84" /NCGR_SAMPLE_ID=MMETSP1089 /ASSEMBLY_ACC=CAM_ASM_000445 /LENGTH=114 /DNA_ID=CAMNT_0026714705 /DNA_START=345 /DNA_END=689 /DNA_ORIENTATION=-